MKTFIIVIAVATVLGGFVGGELTGNTFMLTGAVSGGVGTAAVLLGLGAFFTAQEERRRKAGVVPPLTPEIGEVFARMASRAGIPGHVAGAASTRSDSVDKPALYRRTVTGLIQTQLMTEYAKPADAFGELMTNKQAAGYVFGLSDAMLQACGLRGDPDSVKDLMDECYKEVFGDFSGHALLSMSLHNQEDPDFHAGRMEGGSEMEEFINRKAPPLGLTRILVWAGAHRNTRPKGRADPTEIPDHSTFGRLMFEIQRVFRRVVSVPPDTKVLQNSSIYDAITPFAYGLAVLRLSEADTSFIGSAGHEEMRRMVEDRMVKNRTEVAESIAAAMPRIPGGPVFKPDVAGIRRKVREELRVALEAVADGGSVRPRIAAQANLLQVYVEAAPFSKDPIIKDRLLSKMLKFSDVYLRNGLGPD